MTTPKAKFAGLALIALILSALTGCRPLPARILVPGQAEVTLPNEAVIFGKFVRQVDGKIRADEERSFDLTPFKDTGRGYLSKRKYRIPAGEESHFYSVVERDSYVIESAEFGNYVARDTIFCYYFGFHMPGQADAYYIGTLFFDLNTILLFAHRGTIHIKDEFEEALKVFKRRNPEFTGKVVKSLMIADRSVPSRVAFGKSVKPKCQERS